MRILAGAILLAALAWAGDREGAENEIRAAKERVQAMLAEAEELERAGRVEDAARVREEAAALKRKVAEAHARSEKASRDDPMREAMKGLETAIVALRRAGHEEAARDLERTADRIRAEMKERDKGGPRAEEAEFVRGSMDTLRLAMKALVEAEKPDAADMVERAIHARELMLAGRRDEEAARIIEKSPRDGQLGEILLMAAGLWREYKQPEKAEQVEKLGRHLLERARMGGPPERVREKERGPGPDDRMAHIEARLEKLEQMLAHMMAKMEERERAAK